VKWLSLLPAAGQLLTGWKAYALAAAVGASAAGGAAWTVQGWRMGAQVERLQAEHAAALVRASERRIEADAAVMDASARLAKLAQEVTDDLQQAQARIDRDRAALSAGRDRLLDAWQRQSAAHRCPAAGDPAAGAAAAAAELVRADVFRSARDRAAELAPEVDRQHAYGVACAARFRQVSEELRGLRERLDASRNP
jgi:hypothetical protein